MAKLDGRGRTMATHFISLTDFGAVMAGLAALSTSSFGLLDATKAVNGGISNIGAGHIKTALKPFDAALNEAIGEDAWWPVVKANWVSGVAKDEQKAKAQALIKLGLSPTTAAAIALASHVDAAALTTAATNLAAGLPLTDADLNVLGRMSATIEALMDAAFERADQQYRNVCRVLAGFVAVGLSWAAWLIWPKMAGTPPIAVERPSLAIALAVGVLAVPLAPVAKDLTSALSAAMQALKTVSKA